MPHKVRSPRIFYRSQGDDRLRKTSKLMLELGYYDSLFCRSMSRASTGLIVLLLNNAGRADSLGDIVQDR
jgi:hypothetical protein